MENLHEKKCYKHLFSALISNDLSIFPHNLSTDLSFSLVAGVFHRVAYEVRIFNTSVGDCNLTLKSIFSSLRRNFSSFSIVCSIAEMAALKQFTFFPSRTTQWLNGLAMNGNTNGSGTKWR